MPGKRKRWLVAVVVGWVVVVAGLAAWSVRHSPPTVAEQRGIGVAVAGLQQAAGVVFAAADGGGRVVALGGLRVEDGCRITPVRRGRSATRDVTVYVRLGDARATLDAVAAALPAGYRAEVTPSRAATRLTFHADAGEFIGIDADVDATAQVITLQLSTGCRPPAKNEPNRADPPAPPAPPTLTDVLNALTAPSSPSAPSVSPSGPAAVALAVQAVACPGGGVAATYAVAGVATPADIQQRLASVTAGATVLRSGASAWAYRKGADAVLVLPEQKQLRVSVTEGC